MQKLLFYLNLFLAGNIKQQNKNKKQYKNYLSSGNIINKVNHKISSSFSSAKTVNFHDTIAKTSVTFNGQIDDLAHHNILSYIHL